jgi:8-oxo-dGTP pyrophosphatase MutT (NUDIX family)
VELIPLASEEKEGQLVLKGFAERKWAETQNLLHLTTLLIPVVRDAEDNRSVVIQIRHERKSFPCCRDVFGGHVSLDAEFWPLLLGQSFSVEGIVEAAAMREANEELRLQRGAAYEPYDVARDRLYQVGATGQARWDGPGNIERSTVFLVPIPENCRLCPMDNVGIDFFAVETELYEWLKLRTEFNANVQYAYKDRAQAAKAGCATNRQSWQFADGVARILLDDPLFTEVDTAIRSLPISAFAAVQTEQNQPVQRTAKRRR